MLGFDVTPDRPSSSISFCRPPPVTSPRRRKSSHTLCPTLRSSRSGFMSCLRMSLSHRYPLTRRRTPTEPASVEHVLTHLPRAPGGTAVLLDERVARARRRIAQRAREQIQLLRIGRQRIRRPPLDQVERVPHPVEEP